VQPVLVDLVCYRPVAEDLELMEKYEDFSKLAG
jgi:hypothetical protein